MPMLENTQTRLSIKSGSTTLTLDKTSGKITLQRKMIFWQRKPIEKPLSEVVSVSVDTSVDRASGVEICHTMVIFQAGDAWALPAAERMKRKATPARYAIFSNCRLEAEMRVIGFTCRRGSRDACSCAPARRQGCSLVTSDNRQWAYVMTIVMLIAVGIVISLVG